MVDNFIIKKQLISKAVITIPYKKTTMAHCKSSISLGWRFLNFCSQNNSLYILGAGASLPEIRVDSNGIKDEISLLNSYDTNLHPRTAFRDRLGLTAFDLYQNKEQEIVQSLYDHTNEGTIEAIFSKQLISPLKETPVQYKVFDYFYPSTLFIFNNDNMHNFVHKRHTILHPHGTINSKFIESEIINECIKNGDVSQNLNRFNRFYKPVPEEKYITSGVPYRTLKHYFNDFKAIIFIGYSFGLQKKDNTIDDQESFEFLMSLIRQACKPILIIDPDLSLLYLRIETAIKIKNIYTIPFEWNCVSEFITSGRHKAAIKNSNGDFNKLINEFYKFEYLLKI